MFEATGALLDDETLELVVGAFVDVSTSLAVELLTCEALELVADEAVELDALAGVLELTADEALLDVALEATDDFTDEAELDTFDVLALLDETAVLPALADDLTDEAVFAGAFVDVSALAGASCLASE